VAIVVSFDSSPAALDVRLHAPTVDLVIVWAAGWIDEDTAVELAVCVERQAQRADDIVVDLSHVTALEPSGVDALRRMHKEAADSGVRVHIAADAPGIRTSLVEAGLGDTTIHCSAAAVIAGLPSGWPDHAGWPSTPN
jgi:anti-anti-sigma regulatory factor